jgi:hypothetical protein
MKTFIEYIAEATGFVGSTEPMHPADMKKHVGAGRFNAVINHPYFSDHFRNKEIVMQYHRADNGLDHMLVAHGDVNGLRRRGEFHFTHSGRKIDTARLAHNWDNERHEGKVVWRHVKSTNDEESK